MLCHRSYPTNVHLEEAGYIHNGRSGIVQKGIWENSTGETHVSEAKYLSIQPSRGVDRQITGTSLLAPYPTRCVGRHGNQKR